MRYSFDDADAEERRETQYFEMFGNRGIYHKGWTAVTRHSTPWVLVGGAAGASTTTSGSSTTPGGTGARRTTVEGASGEAPRAPATLPHRGRPSTTSFRWTTGAAERFNPDIAGRPTLVQGNSQLLFGGMGRLTESSVVSIKNKSHAVTAEVVVPDGGANGVIVAQGGGVRRLEPLRCRTGKPRYCYNLFGVQRFNVDGDRAAPAGRRTRCGWSSPTTAGGSARAAIVTLFVDGEPVGKGEVDATVPMIFSADETRDVGMEGAHPRERGLRPEGQRVHRARSTGSQIDVAEAAEDLDHLISPEERLRIAMARQ